MAETERMDEIKSYIGTKVVQAEPMTDGDFQLSKGNNWEPNKPHTVGYKVIYEDGYTSWSPKEVFERCYREITEKEKALI